jgi:hypothetical protein
MIRPVRSSVIVACPQCGAALPNDVITATVPLPCTHCGAEVQVEAFPALVKGWTQSVQSGEPLREASQASCFYHPDKLAVVPCSSCGRFLCSLCDIQLASERFCPACIEQGRQKGRMDRLVTQRTLHDRVALSLAVIPLLFFWITLVTAPTAIYLAMRYWNSPCSILPRTKVRFVFAILIGAFQIVGWTAFLTYSLI